MHLRLWEGGWPSLKAMFFFSIDLVDHWPPEPAFSTSAYLGLLLSSFRRAAMQHFFSPILDAPIRLIRHTKDQQSGRVLFRRTVTKEKSTPLPHPDSALNREAFESSSHQ